MKMLKDEKGQTLIEYIMIISFIVIILVMGIPPMRESVAHVLNRAIQIFQRTESPSSFKLNEYLSLISPSISHDANALDLSGNLML